MKHNKTISVPAADAHSGGKPVRLSGSSHRPDLPSSSKTTRSCSFTALMGWEPARRHQRHAPTKA